MNIAISKRLFLDMNPISTTIKFQNKVLESSVKKHKMPFEKMITPFFLKQIVKLTSLLKKIMTRLSVEASIILLWPIFAEI